MNKHQRRICGAAGITLGIGFGYYAICYFNSDFNFHHWLIGFVGCVLSFAAGFFFLFADRD